MSVHELAAATPACGGKALGLARLIAAGLPVPEGFVVDDTVFRAIAGELDPNDTAAIGHQLGLAAERIANTPLPTELEADVVRRAAALGTLVVRSSATIEDGETGAAAGVFSSRGAVPAADVWAAIRAVWTSALTPLAAAYARRRGGRISIGVIVQRFVPGERITVYTRAPGKPTGDAMIQRGGDVETMPRPDDPASGTWRGESAGVERAPMPQQHAAGLLALALRAETAIGAGAGADVELVEKGDRSPFSVQRSDRQHIDDDAANDKGAPSPFSVRRSDGEHIDDDAANDKGAPSPFSVRRSDREHIDDDAANDKGAPSPFVVRRSDAEPEANVSVFVVQARPIVHPIVRARPAVPAALLAALVADGRVWKWDVAHNPDPLSPAQAGLVERVDRAELAPYSLRVCAGYLYSAPRGEAPTVAAAVTREELAARAGEIEARLAETLGAEVPPLDEAIARYLAFYRIWATELGPLISATRAGLTPAQLAGARPSAVEATLLATARGEIDEGVAVGELGVLAPAWDVAVPTYGERPGVLRDAIARARAALGSSLAGRARTLVGESGDSDGAIPIAHDDARAENAPAAVRRDGARADARESPTNLGAVSERVLVAQNAADLAERDDHWFARAQLLVRKAVIARARDRGIDPDDAFWIPLEDLEQNQLDPDDVRRRASAARNAAARAGQWSVPRIVGNAVEPPAIALRGIGTGPRVTGRIVRLATLGSTVAVGSGDIVVARAVTPALAVAVIGCAALVSETGGLLDHGAALARELGIPCVVGCHDAWSLLTDGMVVTVDGDAGSVEIAS